MDSVLPEEPRRPALAAGRPVGFLTPDEVDALVDETVSWLAARRAFQEAAELEGARAREQRRASQAQQELQQADQLQVGTGAPQAAVGVVSSPTGQGGTSLEEAWRRNYALREIAPTLESSMTEVQGLLAPLAGAIADMAADAHVVAAVPGTFHNGGPDTPYGDGATAKLKELSPQFQAICATLADGSVIFVLQMGMTLTYKAQEIKQRNFIKIKVAIVKVPAIELVGFQDGQMDCPRFSFDDLPEKLAREFVAGRTLG